MKEDNYIYRKKQLLKGFDRSVARSKPVLITRYGDEQANSLISECRREYEALIPQIPFIGHKSPFLIFLIPTSRYLAVYRVLQRKGLTIEEACQVIYLMNEAEWKAVPMILGRIISYLWFSPLFIWRIKRRAKESQKREHAGGYVLTFIEGNDQTFDWGLDYTECAGCKFLSQQGVPELTPLMCSFDKTASETLGWGLTRTTTIADGYERCDFRFKKGGKTKINISPSIEGSF
ncbi:MAG: L-2-amino-thiazoline-4-carboxylic acid hydrolase [Smithellaceae bacterium]